MLLAPIFYIFFFNDTATTEIYTLSLHDALPIYASHLTARSKLAMCSDQEVLEAVRASRSLAQVLLVRAHRSEEHTSELQSRPHLVCRLLLEKKKNTPRPRNVCD